MTQLTNIPDDLSANIRATNAPTTANLPNQASKNWISEKYQTCTAQAEIEMGPKPKNLMPAVAWIERYYGKLQAEYQACANTPVPEHIRNPPPPPVEDDYEREFDHVGGDFSDIRLKHNIRRVGSSPSGIPTYTFQYLADKTEQVYHGTMAQDLLRDHPNAVGKRDGFYAVAYNLIDVDFYPVLSDIKE